MEWSRVKEASLVEAQHLVLSFESLKRSGLFHEVMPDLSRRERLLRLARPDQGLNTRCYRLIPGTDSIKIVDICKHLSTHSFKKATKCIH